MATRHRDDGFTLTELVVVLALLSFVLVVAYNLFELTRRSTDHSNREAWISQEIAAPLEFSEKVLSQQYRIDVAFPGPTPNRLAFLTNRVSGTTGERYVIEATADHRLLVTTSKQGATTAPVPVAWSTANYNIAAGEPLFRYYDVNGAVIDDMSRVHEYARHVTVTIVTEHDGRRFQDQRTVFFRNYY